MKAIRLLAPATFAISAAFNPAQTAERNHSLAPITYSLSESVSSKPCRVRTDLVRTFQERHIIGHDECGNLLSYFVTVVRLRDVFSDGSTKHFTRTLGA